MGNINYGRVLVGGLAAGVIILIGETILNFSVVGDDWQAWTDAHELPALDGLTGALYVLMDILLGVSIVLIYALIRPRCGPGPKTAVISGFLVWFLVWLLGLGIMGASFEMPGTVIVMALVWGVAEVLLASLLGAWLYREDASEAY